MDQRRILAWAYIASTAERDGSSSVDDDDNTNKMANNNTLSPPQMLVSTRMALEAKVKTEGSKFLKRDRDKEEDKKFMARTAAGESLE